MATTGMNIGADSTLVASAGSLARSMGPADITQSLDSMLEARGELLDTMETNFKKAALAADIAGSELRDTIDAFGVKLNNGELSQTERQEMQAKMEDYRARMKDIPFGRKGKKQREDLMYEINREIKTASNVDAAKVDVLTTLQNNLHDPNQLGADYTNFLNQVAKSAAEEETDPGFSKTKNEKGETVYSYKFTNEAGEEQTIEGTIFDIQKKVNGTKKDYEFIKDQNDVIFGWQDWATQHPNANFDEVYNRISSDMETTFNQSPDKFRSMINHPMGWSEKSYVDTLKDTSSPEFKQVLKVLNDMDASEFDYDGDGDIDGADFVNEENINTMIKALTDPDASQRRVAHKAAAKFYADTEAKKAFDFGVRDRRKETGVGETKSGHVGANMPGIGWVHAEKFAQLRAHIDRGEDFTGNYGSYKFDSDTGMYTDGDGNELSRYEVADKEGADKGDPPNKFVWTSTSAQTQQVDEALLRGEVTSAPGSFLAADGTMDAEAASDQLNNIYKMRAQDGRGFYLEEGYGIIGQSDVMFMRDATGTVMEYTQEMIDALADLGYTSSNWPKLEVGKDIRFTMHQKYKDSHPQRFNALMSIPPFNKAKEDLIKITEANRASGTTQGSGAQYNPQ